MNPATPSSPPPPQAPVPARAPVLDLGALHPAVAGSAPETWYDRTRRRVADFLPMGLLLILALATGWLVHNMPKEESPRAAPPASEPDYYMRDFRIRSYDGQGALHNDITAVYGEHLPVDDTIHARTVQGYSQDSRGADIRSTADRAISDRKGDDVRLFDHVHVVRTAPPAPGASRPAAPLGFAGDFLHILRRGEHISSDQPVRITRGTDVMTGSGLDYTGESKVLEVRGRVHATILPASAAR